MHLYDNHGRKINYLRLAVTDRCNLRCFYCMPEKGIKYVPKNELMSYEEMEKIIRVLSKNGHRKSSNYGRRAIRQERHDDIFEDFKIN